jgi:uncharacterized protein DUF6632
VRKERAFKIVLTIVGLFFTAAIYPVVMILWQRDHDSYADAMGLSLYVTLGVLLLMAVRNPSAHRSLIDFAIWSSFAHASVMATMVIRDVRSRGEWPPVVILLVIATALLALAPERRPASANEVGPNSAVASEGVG